MHTGTTCRSYSIKQRNYQTVGERESERETKEVSQEERRGTERKRELKNKNFPSRQAQPVAAAEAHYSAGDSAGAPSSTMGTTADGWYLPLPTRRLLPHRPSLSDASPPSTPHSLDGAACATVTSTTSPGEHGDSAPGCRCCACCGDVHVRCRSGDVVGLPPAGVATGSTGGG